MALDSSQLLASSHVRSDAVSIRAPFHSLLDAFPGDSACGGFGEHSKQTEGATGNTFRHGLNRGQRICFRFKNIVNQRYDEIPTFSRFYFLTVVNKLNECSSVCKNSSLSVGPQNWHECGVAACAPSPVACPLLPRNCLRRPHFRVQ